MNKIDSKRRKGNSEPPTDEVTRAALPADIRTLSLETSTIQTCTQGSLVNKRAADSPRLAPTIIGAMANTRIMPALRIMAAAEAAARRADLQAEPRNQKDMVSVQTMLISVVERRMRMLPSAVTAPVVHLKENPAHLPIHMKLSIEMRTVAADVKATKSESPPSQVQLRLFDKAYTALQPVVTSSIINSDRRVSDIQVCCHRTMLKLHLPHIIWLPPRST